VQLDPVLNSGVAASSRMGSIGKIYKDEIIFKFIASAHILGPILFLISSI
jgi:hypothetical protein